MKPLWPLFALSHDTGLRGPNSAVAFFLLARTVFGGEEPGTKGAVPIEEGFHMFDVSVGL